MEKYESYEVVTSILDIFRFAWANDVTMTIGYHHDLGAYRVTLDKCGYKIARYIPDYDFYHHGAELVWHVLELDINELNETIRRLTDEQSTT